MVRLSIESFYGYFGGVRTIWDYSRQYLFKYSLDSSTLVLRNAYIGLMRGMYASNYLSFLAMLWKAPLRTDD